AKAFATASAVAGMQRQTSPDFIKSFWEPLSRRDSVAVGAAGDPRRRRRWRYPLSRRRRAEGTPAPRWFHDGKAVIVVLQNPGKTRGLYRVDLKSKELKQVFEFDPMDLRGGIYAISQDDKTLFVAGRKRDVNNQTEIVDRIVAIDLETGHQRQICSLPATGAT